jgi:nicotinamidase-related amidase
MKINGNNLNLKQAALILCDLQNDFLHPKGAYGRNGVTSVEIAAVPSRMVSVANAMREAGGWVISTHFTLVPGHNGEPLISDHLKAVRPFLTKGDFTSGGWGQDIVDELKPSDAKIEKVAFSAFYMSRLEWFLRKISVDTLIFSGIVTNGGVSSTLRDAHVRDFSTILLRDGCAAFDLKTHETAVEALEPVAQVMTCDEFIRGIKIE